MFREWQQLSQTKLFVERLTESIETLRDNAIDFSDKNTVEQIAISAVERKAEARVLYALIEILTSKEEDDNEQT